MALPQNSSLDSPDAVVFEGVRKDYKGRPALNGIDLKVPKAGIFALVGPDGAGKSTLLRTACGLIRPDSGRVRVFGEDPSGRNGGFRRRIGYLSQRFSLYGDLSIDENIAFSAEIFGMRDYRTRREELLEMTGLTPFRGRPADKLSGGMRQKLALACTLVHDPEIILLDEPTNGVDPVSRREFWRLLRGLGRAGITLMMSTPYMDEAERADRVAILYEGRLILSGVPGEIRRGWDKRIFEFFCDRNRDAAALLAGSRPEWEAQAFGDRVHLAVPKDGPEPEDVVALLVEGGLKVTHSGTVGAGLENVFLSLISQGGCAAGGIADIGGGFP